MKEVAENSLKDNIDWRDVPWTDCCVKFNDLLLYEFDRNSVSIVEELA